jgi:hypothetical protein
MGLGLLAGSTFYCTWYYSDLAQTVFDTIKINKTAGLTVIAAIGAVLSMPLLSLVLSYLAETGLECFKELQSKAAGADTNTSRSLKKSFLILAGIYIAGISAILRANFNYIDDMGRVASGYKGWENFSRVLSNTFSTFIHMDNYLTDISPLPQLIAAVVMALSGIVLLAVLYERTNFTMIEILAVVPLCLNPYFLECISYKFDSPYMAVSVLCSILPLLYRKRSKIEYIVVSAAGTIVVCTTYQASCGIYPMLVVLMMLRMWNRQEESNRRIAQFCLHSVIGYGVGMLIFKIFIMTSSYGYVSNSLPGIKAFIPNLVQNLGRYYSYVLTDFKWWWLVIIALLAAGFVRMVAYTSKCSRLPAMLLSVLALFCMGILCFGLYPALEGPLYEPRAMYGFAVLLVLLMAAIAGQKDAAALKALVALFSWVVFVFAFTYGNALYSQKEYTDFVISQVIEDLNDLEIFNSGNKVTVQIAGSIGYAPVINNMPQNYQILNRLIPVNFRESWMWGQYSFYNYYGLRNVVWDDSIDLTEYDLPVIEEHMYETIRGNDNYILVELKGLENSNWKWVRYDEDGRIIRGDVIIDNVPCSYDKLTGAGLDNAWKEIDGASYWYEKGVRQGVKYNEDGTADLSYRGKEIYDAEADAWYWLDNVDNGKKAVSKDVYQESDAGVWGDTDNGDGSRSGKWVRYDSQGHMIKGWCAGYGESAREIDDPEEANGEAVYYFDPIYGTMAKGYCTIDDVEYYFNTEEGYMERVVQAVRGLSKYTGWKTIDGAEYWYENGQRQILSGNSEYRGKEVYDPDTDAWYWIDNVDGGKKAVSKDVYQESDAGEWGDIDNGDGSRSGKWVRYDSQGHMIKGWCAGYGENAREIDEPEEANGEAVYYFDPIYGTMAKGNVRVDGAVYTFDTITGVLIQ